MKFNIEKYNKTKNAFMILQSAIAIFFGLLINERDFLYAIGADINMSYNNSFFSKALYFLGFTFSVINFFLISPYIFIVLLLLLIIGIYYNDQYLDYYFAIPLFIIFGGIYYSYSLQKIYNNWRENKVKLILKDFYVSVIKKSETFIDKYIKEKNLTRFFLSLNKVLLLIFLITISYSTYTDNPYTIITYLVLGYFLVVLLQQHYREKVQEWREEIRKENIEKPITNNAILVLRSHKTDEKGFTQNIINAFEEGASINIVCPNLTIINYNNITIFPEDKWLQEVGKLIEKSIFIVVIAGSTSGIIKEINEISRRKRWQNVLIIFQPINENYSLSDKKNEVEVIRKVLDKKVFIPSKEIRDTIGIILDKNGEVEHSFHYHEQNWNGYNEMLFISSSLLTE